MIRSSWVQRCFAATELFTGLKMLIGPPNPQSATTLLGSRQRNFHGETLASGWDRIYVIEMAALRSNQALEPTPDRRENSFRMISSVHFVAALALVRRGSACSR